MDAHPAVLCGAVAYMVHPPVLQCNVKPMSLYLAESKAMITTDGRTWYIHVYCSAPDACALRIEQGYDHDDGRVVQEGARDGGGHTEPKQRLRRFKSSLLICRSVPSCKAVWVSRKTGDHFIQPPHLPLRIVL